jgi:AraC family transcriptional regulator of adaptative response/methylated-DNA-[protein]-cysteine methyltransferase
LSDGTFVYAATTTGIYCRPSCPARHPHRRNSVILQTAAEAERQGYTACGRCHPGQDSLTPAENSVKAALDYIGRHVDQSITLGILSRVSGLSPNHLQQTFTRIVGLSPKALCNAFRLARLRQYLRLGESVSSAIYAVGYGSSRALYEKTSTSLGMTPAAYRRGGDGIRIRYWFTSSTLGRVLVARTERGTCAVLLGRDSAFLLRELRAEFPTAVFVEHVASRQWLDGLKSCQREDPMLSKLPLRLRGQIFQARAWKALQ